jgi:hypothetical protein
MDSLRRRKVSQAAISPQRVRTRRRRADLQKSL